MLEKAIKNLKEFLGEGNEFVDSAHVAVKDRITSPFYGYFVIFFIIINWRFFYSAFFLDQELIFQKFGLLRIEYLQELLPTVWSLAFFWRFLLEPVALTVLAFWLFPYWTRIFYRKSIKNQNALKVIQLQESRKEKREQRELVGEETSLIKKEVEKAKEEKRAAREAPEVLWEREFSEFRKSNVFGRFNQIINAVYKYQGYTEYGSAAVDTDVLLYADSGDIATIEQTTSGTKISLTPKGKFFVRRFAEVQSLESP